MSDDDDRIAKSARVPLRGLDPDYSNEESKEPRGSKWHCLTCYSSDLYWHNRKWSHSQSHRTLGMLHSSAEYVLCTYNSWCIFCSRPRKGKSIFANFNWFSKKEMCTFEIQKVLQGWGFGQKRYCRVGVFTGR